MWVALASAIVAVAASFGAQHVIDLVQRLKLRAKGMSSDQIISKLMTIVKKAEANHTGFMNQVASRINALPNADTLLSSRAASSLRQTRKDLETKMGEANQELAKLEPLEQRIATYATQPESYRMSKAGQADLATLKQDVEKTLKE